MYQVSVQDFTRNTGFLKLAPRKKKQKKLFQINLGHGFPPGKEGLTSGGRTTEKLGYKQKKWVCGRYVIFNFF